MGRRRAPSGPSEGPGTAEAALAERPLGPGLPVAEQGPVAGLQPGQGVGRGDARVTGHLFYPYFIDAMKDGLAAACAASELGAALSALMHHSKKSNIATFDPDAMNKLVVRCIDKVESAGFKGIVMAAT